jgi:hypothetical protein
MGWYDDLLSWEGKAKANRELAYQNTLREGRAQQVTDAMTKAGLYIDRQKQFGSNYDPSVGPSPAISGYENIDLYKNLQTAGIDPNTFNKSNIENTRAQMLNSAANDLDGAALANAANNLDASSTRLVGGVAYDRFSTDNPIVDQSDYQEWHGKNEKAEALINGQRQQLLTEANNNPDLGLPFKLDANNSKITFKPKFVDAQVDGKSVKVMASPNGDGTFTYSYDETKPLVIPPKQATTPSRIREYNILKEKFGEEKAQNLVFNRSEGTQDQYFRDQLKIAQKSPNTGFGNNAKKVMDSTLTAFYQAYPTGTAPADNPDNFKGITSLEAAELAFENGQIGERGLTALVDRISERQQSNQFSSADEVKAAYQNGTLSEADALAALNKFGYQ